MKNFRMLVQYDGTDFAGWQIQPGKPTIQGLLSDCLTRMEGHPVRVHGSGRTDAGAHALGQVASFRLSREFTSTLLRKAINAQLPPSIRVMQIEEAEPGFHALRGARSKTYRYQIYLGAVISPFLHRFVWHAPYSIDPLELQPATRLLLGVHDFGSFCSGQTVKGRTVRAIYASECAREDDLLSFTITGDGFLRYMVRRLTSGLYSVGRKRLELASFADLLEHPRENSLVPPLPAKGLTLVKVDY